MALACNPRLLLADEPTTALDVTIQAQVLELLTTLQHERGMGIMLITHDLGLVARHAHTVCVMYAGRVMEYGPVSEVLSKPLHPYTRALLACRPSMREKKPRLRTVPEIINDPSEFAPLANGRTPWWPSDGQGNSGARRKTGANPELVQAVTGHSVACESE
jgi:ABC-type dipeptide/oligopeptide/nickel transport system ATPase component